MADRKRLLELALSGLKREMEELEQELADAVRGAAGPIVDAGAAEMGVRPRKKRRMSAAGRKAISEAQKTRWAARRNS